MRTSRPARLTGGGPIWDLRTPKRAAGLPTRTSPVPEADAAMALKDAITGAVAALGKGDVAQARAMKRRAWEYVALLHPAQTVRQRRTLGMLGRRIAQAERTGRTGQRIHRHSGRPTPASAAMGADPLPAEADTRQQSPGSAATARTSSFAGRPAAADDGGMAQVPGDERCKHGEIAAWCGESECMAARKGLPVRVWRTPYGNAYHRTPTAKRCLKASRWPSVTVARLTPRSLSRCQRPCPPCSANASTVSRRTSPRTRSHARSGPAGYGSTDSCWNGSKVQMAGGKAW